MKLTLRQQITQFAHLLQSELFPLLEVELGELSEPAKRLVATLEMIPLARFVPSSRGWVGRPPKDRLAIANAFVAKAVYGFGLTTQLLEALDSDAQLRRICGWEEAWQVPKEWTFARAFAEFARMELPQFVHETLIRETQRERLIGNIARDSTAIEARERFPEPASPATPKPKVPRSAQAAPLFPAEPSTPAAPAETAPAATTETPAPAAPKAKPGKRGPHKRWKGGKPKTAPRDDTRIQKQRTMKLPEMLADLPKACNIGVKTSASGFTQSWRGYKLHWDVADGQIPISAILTSASVHDSQVALPLIATTTQRVTYCYDLMDSAYDAQGIKDYSREKNHVPIVDPANRGRRTKSVIAPGAPLRELSWAEAEHYKERTMVERVNGRLKDEFGGRTIRVRGAVKVMAHLMFGVLALTVDQLLRLARA